jgi:hypothetical protein
LKTPRLSFIINNHDLLYQFRCEEDVLLCRPFGQSQVSRKVGLDSRVSKFPGFRWFLAVSQLGQPLEPETETQDY